MAAAILLAAAPAAAHVTPNVELVGRGSFLSRALPSATQFFQKKLPGDQALAGVEQALHWKPSSDDTAIYVGRDAQGQRVGTALFVWVPSQHGPVSVAVAFAPDDAVTRVTVSEVGSEPLSWVQPLLDAGGMKAFEGLKPGQRPDAARVAPSVDGRMSRYYAQVIAQGVARAQAVETALSW